MSVETKIPDEILDMDAPEVLDDKNDQGGPPRKKPCPTTQEDRGLKSKGCVNTKQCSPTAGSSEKQKNPNGIQRYSEAVRDGETASSVKESGSGCDADSADVAKSSMTDSSKSKKGTRSMIEATEAHCLSATTATSTKRAGQKKQEKKGRNESRTLVATQYEVFQFTFPLCHLVSKFTTPHDVKSSGKTCNFLESKTESWMTLARTQALAVPVASLQKTKHRASRTALMFKRGTADPNTSVQQLKTRAFNSHDFLFLNPCTNTFKLVEMKDLTVAMGTEASGADTSLSPPRTTEEEFVTSSGGLTSAATSVSLTAPVSIPGNVPSLEKFLEMSGKDLVFNEVDLSLARFIHDCALQQRTLGVPLSQLQVL